MKRLHTKKSTALIVLAGLAAAAIVSTAAAYPPDNAAVLYYRAFLTYQKPEGAIAENLHTMIRDGASPSEETKQFLAGQNQIVRSVTTAAEIDLCDWGYDYSEGFALLMPGLADMRNIARIVLADGLLALREGDSKVAADRCITTYKMARHLKNEFLIGNLVAIAMESLAKSAMQQILAQPLETEPLNLLKKELAQMSLSDVPLEHCMHMEMKLALEQPYEKLFADVFATSHAGEEKKAPPKIDRELAQKSLAYYKQRMNEYVQLVRLPYPRATAEIEKLHAAMEADAKTRPECELTQATIPALKSMYSLHTKAHTDRNALRAAIEIYRVRARTGKLPDRLPPNLPQDMFSGKPFEYEITDTGFTLRCRAKNEKSGKIEEYQFKTPK